MKKNILLVQSFLVLPLLTGVQQITASEKKGTVLPRDAQPTLPTPAQKKQAKKIAAEARKATEEARKAAEAILVAQESAPTHNTPADTPQPSEVSFEKTIIELPIPSQLIIEEQIQTQQTTLSASKRAPLPTPEKKSVIPTEDEVKARMANVFTQMIPKPVQVKEEKSNWNIASTFYAMIKNFTSKEDISDPIVDLEETPSIPANNLLAASVYEPQPIIRQSLTPEQLKKAKNDPLGFIKEAFELKTFDPEDKDHMKLLMKAAENLVLVENVVQLKDLLDACRVNYPNIKLEKKVALQIRKRFNLHEENTRKTSLEDIAIEDAKFVQTQNQIFADNAALILALTQQLEHNNALLANAHQSYMLATNSILANQTRVLKHSHDAKQVLGKLYRKENFTAEGFNSHSLNIMKKLEANHNEINYNLEHLSAVYDAIHSTLDLVKPETTNILQIDNK